MLPLLCPLHSIVHPSLLSGSDKGPSKNDIIPSNKGRAHIATCLQRSLSCECGPTGRELSMITVADEHRQP